MDELFALDRPDRRVWNVSLTVRALNGLSLAVLGVALTLIGFVQHPLTIAVFVLDSLAVKQLVQLSAVRP